MQLHMLLGGFATSKYRYINAQLATVLYHCVSRLWDWCQGHRRILRLVWECVRVDELASIHDHVSDR